MEENNHGSVLCTIEIGRQELKRYLKRSLIPYRNNPWVGASYERIKEIIRDIRAHETSILVLKHHFNPPNETK